MALTIDSDQWPHDVLSTRGTARVELVDGVVPEYARSADRYFGEEGGKAWPQEASGLFDQWARTAIRPEWVNVLDFRERFPVELAKAMATPA